MRLQIAITTIVIVVGLAGCGDCPTLPDVPIRSASPEEAAIGHEVLGEFASEVVLPVCVNHVAFGGMLVHKGGQYNTSTRGIRLAETADLSSIEPRLRHELCHAVDRQNDLIKGREDLFFYEFPRDFAKGRVADEAFADTCMLSRGALSVLWPSDCSSESHAAGAQIVRDEVLAIEDPSSIARFEAAASIPVAPDSWNLTVEVTVNQNFLLEYLTPAGGDRSYGTRLLLDPETGEVIGEYESTVDEVGFNGSSPPDGWTAIDVGSLSPSMELQVAELVLPTGTAVRVHARRDGSWGRTEGLCPNRSTRFITRMGELWSYQVDGDTVSWGRWTESTPHPD